MHQITGWEINSDPQQYELKSSSFVNWNLVEGVFKFP